MKKLGVLLVLAMCFVSLNARSAFAHLRTYAWTEEYRTIPQGNFEFEDWTTFKIPDGSKSNQNTIQYQGELEYGVTDRLTFANYERWKTTNVVGSDNSTVYEGFKFETKYRIGEKGKYGVDPLIYVEWATDPREHDHHNEIETKLVLSKDAGKFNAVYNQIMENQLARDGRTKHEFSAGANYEVLPDVRVGVEFNGQLWAPGSHRNKLSLGPTLAWENKYIWVVAGALFGVNHAADDHQVRLIVGVPLPFDSPSFFKRASNESLKAA